MLNPHRGDEMAETFQYNVKDKAGKPVERTLDSVLLRLAETIDKQGRLCLPMFNVIKLIE